MPQTLLIAEHDAAARELLLYHLRAVGYRLFFTENAADTLRICDRTVCDLLLLDTALPGGGMDACQSLRSRSPTAALPIIVLSDSDEEEDKVTAFNMGADDYVTKPIAIRELAARIQALLRRAALIPNQPDPPIVEGLLVIDPKRYIITYKDNQIDLTHKEFELLYLLARNKGRVMTREDLQETVWGYDYDGGRTIDVHVRHIRQKIGNTWIETVRGVGYRFAAP